MSIAENIARIREEIDAAARETGRTGKDITLVGASKMIQWAFDPAFAMVVQDV